MTNNELTVEEEMPTRITVMKTMTYDVEQLITDLKYQGMENPSFDDVVGMIEEFAKDDFSCGHGHEVSIRDLIFINADTQEEI